jgi:hypothetical protein
VLSKRAQAEQSRELTRDLSRSTDCQGIRKAMHELPPTWRSDKTDFDYLNANGESLRNERTPVQTSKSVQCLVLDPELRVSINLHQYQALPWSQNCFSPGRSLCNSAFTTYNGTEGGVVHHQELAQSDESLPEMKLRCCQQRRSRSRIVARAQSSEMSALFAKS